MKPTAKSGLIDRGKKVNHLPSSNPVRKATPDNISLEEMRPKAKFQINRRSLLKPSLNSVSQENRPVMESAQSHNEIIRLQNILGSKEDEIQSLKSRLVMNQTEIVNFSSNSSGNNPQLQALIARLTQENDELRAQLQSLRQTHNLLGGEHDRLLEILREKDESINLFGEENIRLRREMEAMEMRSQEIQTRFNRQSLEYEAQANDLDEAQRIISRLELQIQGNNNRASSSFTKVGNQDILILSDEINRLRVELVERDQDLTSAAQEIIALKAREQAYVEKEKEIETLIEELGNLRERIGNLELDNTGLRGQNKNLLSELSGANLQSSDYSKLVEECNRQRQLLAQKDNEISQFEYTMEQRMESEVSYVRLESSNEITRLHDEAKFMEELIRRLEADLASLETENKALLQRISGDKSSEDIALLAAEISRLRGQLNERDSVILRYEAGPVKDIQVLASTLAEREATIRQLSASKGRPGLESLLTEKDSALANLRIQNSNLLSELHQANSRRSFLPSNRASVEINENLLSPLPGRISNRQSIRPERSSIRPERASVRIMGKRESFAPDYLLDVKDENIKFHRDEAETLQRQLREAQAELSRLESENQGLRQERKEADFLISNLRSKEAENLNLFSSNAPSFGQPNSSELQRLNEESFKLKFELDSYRRDKSNLQNDINRLALIIQSLSNENEAKNREIADLHEKMRQFTINDTSSSAEVLKQENGVLRNLLEGKLAELDEAERQLRELRYSESTNTKFALIEVDLRSARDKIRELENENSRLRLNPISQVSVVQQPSFGSSFEAKEIQRLRDESLQKDIEISRLKTQLVPSFDTNSYELTSKVERLQSQLLERDMTIAQLQSRNTGQITSNLNIGSSSTEMFLNNKIRELELKVINLEQELSIQRNNQGDIGFELQGKDNRILELQRQLDISRKRVFEYENKPTESLINPRIAEFERTMNEKNSRIHELEHQVSMLRLDQESRTHRQADLIVEQRLEPGLDTRLIVLADEVVRLKSILKEVLRRVGEAEENIVVETKYINSSIIPQHEHHVDRETLKKRDLNKIMEMVDLNNEDIVKIKEEISQREEAVSQREEAFEQHLITLYSHFPELSSGQQGITAFANRVQAFNEELEYNRELSKKLAELDRTRVQQLHVMGNELQFARHKLAQSKALENELGRLRLLVDLMERRKVEEVNEAREAAERAKIEILRDAVNITIAPTSDHTSSERLNSILEELSSYQARAAEAEGQAEALFSQVSSLERTIDELRAAYDAERQRLHLYEEKLRSLNSAQSLITKVEFQESTINKMQTHIQGVTEANQLLQAQLSSTQKNLVSNKQEWVQATEAARQWLLQEQASMKEIERAQFENEVNCLKKQIGVLEEELVSKFLSDAEIREQTRNLEQLKRELEKTREMVFTSSNNSSKLEIALADVKDQLTRANRRNEFLEKSLENSEKVLRTLAEREMEAEEMKSKILVLENSVDELTRRISLQAEEVSDFHSNRQKMHEALSSLRFENERLSSLHRLKEAEARNLVQEKEGLLQERSEWLTKVQPPVASETNLTSKLEAAYSERLNSLNMARISLQEALASKEAELSEFRRREEQYASLLSDKDDKLASLQTYISNLQGNIQSSKSNFDFQMKETHTTYSDKLLGQIEKVKVASQREISNMESRLRQAEERAAEIQDSAMSLKEENERMRNWCSKLEEEKKSYSLRIDEMAEGYRFKAEELKTRLHSTFQSYWNQQAELLHESYSKERDQLSQTLDSLNAQNFELLGRLESAQASLVRQQTENQALVSSSLEIRQRQANEAQGFGLKVSQLESLNGVLKGAIEGNSSLLSDLKYKLEKEFSEALTVLRSESKEELQVVVEEIEKIHGLVIDSRVRDRVWKSDMKWERYSETKLKVLYDSLFKAESEYERGIQEMNSRLKQAFETSKKEAAGSLQNTSGKTLQMLKNNYEEQIHDLKEERDRLSAECERRNSEIVEAQRRLSQKEDELFRQRSLSRNAEGDQKERIREVQRRIKGIVEESGDGISDSERNAFENSINHLKARIIELEKSQKALFNKYIRLQQQHSEKAREFASNSRIDQTSIVVQLEVIETENKELKEQLASMEHEKSVLNAQINSFKSTVESQRTVIQQLYSAMAEKNK